MFDDDRKQIVREPEIRFVHEPRTEVIEMSESSPGYSGIIDKYVSFLCIKKRHFELKSFSNFSIYPNTFINLHKLSITNCILLYKIFLFIIIKLPLDENREEFFQVHLWLVKYWRNGWNQLAPNMAKNQKAKTIWTSFIILKVFNPRVKTSQSTAYFRPKMIFLY